MQNSIQIRPAQPADADVAAVLLYSAYTHTQVSYPLQDEHASGFIERLLNYFRQDENRFSYQYIHVAEQDATVVGLVLSFGGQDEPRLNAAVGSWLEREAQDDEWYIDALAVLKDRERQGIGTRLLQTAEEQADQHHYQKIALRVAPDNEPALNLYTHQHYVVIQQTILYQHPYLRMVKTVGDEPFGSD